MPQEGPSAHPSWLSMTLAFPFPARNCSISTTSSFFVETPISLHLIFSVSVPIFQLKKKDQFLHPSPFLQVEKESEDCAEVLINGSLNAQSTEIKHLNFRGQTHFIFTKTFRLIIGARSRDSRGKVGVINGTNVIKR